MKIPFRILFFLLEITFPLVLGNIVCLVSREPGMTVRVVNSKGQCAFEHAVDFMRRVKP